MTKDREERKKEKKLMKEKKERKERKRREAEELLKVKEKKISKKQKSKSKEPEKSKKKSKKHEVVEEKSPKKSKEKKKKLKKVEESDESEEEPETPIIKSQPVTVPIATTSYKESDSDFESDKDIKVLIESYTKEELINLIYRTAERGSQLISAVLESADRDSSQRNIFVRGLGWDTTHENLKAAFEVHGEIEECSVVMDKDTGRAKGYGFVLFKTRNGAREALRNPEKRMYNRTVICNIAKPPNAAKAREPVESVKIDLTHTANQSELVLPGLDMAHGLDKGHQQPQNMLMYGGPNMPFYGQPPGFNPMYGAMMGNQAAMMSNQMVAGLPPKYRSFSAGMMNQGPMVQLAGQYVGDSNGHMGLAGQYVGDSNGNGVGPTPCFDGERAWYLR